VAGNSDNTAAVQKDGNGIGLNNNACDEKTNEPSPGIIALAG